MKIENKKSSILMLALLLVSAFAFGNCGTVPGVCGDGIVDANESCDDGNTVDGDGCSSLCVTETAAIPSCGISGAVTSSVTIAANTTCSISGIVLVASPAILTIGAGSTIVADAASTPTTSLVIQPGAKLIAVGTATAPIVFTSSKSAGSRSYGDWGGVVLRGNATVNTGAGASYSSEVADLGVSGGSNDADNSGDIEYVRIEFGGHQNDPTHEYNGLTFEAVGNGTVVNYVHAHNNADDGVEFFGGTVDMKHFISTNNHDDMLDWTYGWRGRVQYVVLGLYGGAGDSTMADSNFIEADNSSTNETLTPIAEPKIYNLTAISDFNSQYKYMFRFRRGTGAVVKNAYVANTCAIPAVESDQSNEALTGMNGISAGQSGQVTGGTKLAAGHLVINNSLFENIAKAAAQGSVACTTSNSTAVAAQAAPVTGMSVTYKNSAATPAAYTLAAGAGLVEFTGNANTVSATMTVAGIDATDPIATGSTFSVAPTTAITANAVNSQTDSVDTFFDSVSFIGAVQDAANNWTTWTTYPAN